MLAAGEVIAEKYRLLEVLGEGAAATVWLARDSKLGIDVAIKTLRPRLATSGRMLRRFVREAEVGERMLSPHIVKVLARGVTEKNVPYTVYEHLDGRDLATVLKDVGRFGFGDARTVVFHACRALARAHSVGVMHRDVKPENLFVTQDDKGKLLVKVLDFGVAQVCCSVDADKPIVGTLEYIAPDILLGERECDVQGDLWSLGVVAFECLTGEMPFPAKTVGELVLRHAKNDRKPLRELREDAPAALEAWIDRALARDHEKRFASAKDMADALEDALKGVEPRTTNKPIPPSTTPPRRMSGTMPYSIIRKDEGD
ncbi:MAG TPA: serine/threonine-protein kinase [Labilithrix sp.]